MWFTTARGSGSHPFGELDAGGSSADPVVDVDHVDRGQGTDGALVVVAPAAQRVLDGLVVDGDVRVALVLAAVDRGGAGAAGALEVGGLRELVVVDSGGQPVDDQGEALGDLGELGRRGAEGRGDG